MSPEQGLNWVAGMLAGRSGLRKRYLQGELSEVDLAHPDLTEGEKEVILRAADYHFNPDIGEEALIQGLAEELDRIREGRPLSFEEGTEGYA